MSESCQTKKRNFAETDLTPPKMPSYKAGKVMEDGECEEAISKVDSAFFPRMAALVPKLLEDSGFKPSETEPTMLLKELLKKGLIDEQLKLTDTTSGAKVALKTALAAVRDANDCDDQPQYIPPINPHQATNMLETNSTKEITEKFNEFVKLDAACKSQVMEANITNSRRISSNEVAILRKHFEDEQLRLYVSKVNMNNVTAKNPYELAQGAKQALKAKVDEIYKAEADMKVTNCSIKELAESKYLNICTILESTKVDVLGKEPKVDSHLGYKTIPICLTFPSVEAKNKLKDISKSLNLNSKDSFPKPYLKQKDRIMEIFKDKASLGPDTWVKADVRLGRPEAPVSLTIQTKRGNSMDKWTTKARVKIMPACTWGRMSDTEKGAHISNAISQQLNPAM